MKNKKIIIILGFLIILFLLVAIVWFVNNNNKHQVDYQKIIDQEEKFTPEFLNDVEKRALDIDVNKKIQVITRDQNGEVAVYRIINQEVDIVNPKQ